MHLRTMALAFGLCVLPAVAADPAVTISDTAPAGAWVTGEVVDAATGQLLPARVYLQSEDGHWLFPVSASSQGSALRYAKQNWINTNAVEHHTTLSAHPFCIRLGPGRYTLTVERGKEYRPLTREFTVVDQPMTLRLPLSRWVNMAARAGTQATPTCTAPPANFPT